MSNDLTGPSEPDAPPQRFTVNVTRVTSYAVLGSGKDPEGAAIDEVLAGSDFAEIGQETTTVGVFPGTSWPAWAISQIDPDERSTWDRR